MQRFRGVAIQAYKTTLAPLWTERRLLALPPLEVSLVVGPRTSLRTMLALLSLAAALACGSSPQDAEEADDADLHGCHRSSCMGFDGSSDVDVGESTPDGSAADGSIPTDGSIRIDSSNPSDATSNPGDGGTAPRIHALGQAGHFMSRRWGTTPIRGPSRSRSATSRRPLSWLRQVPKSSCARARTTNTSS